MTQVLESLSKKIKKEFNKGTLIVLPEKDEKISRASRNISKIKVIRADNLNVLSVLSHQYLMILTPQDAIKVIRETYGLTR